jgi:hypothetical protein
MISDGIEHRLIGNAGVQPGRDRHTAWTRHRLHPTPLPQLLGRHTMTIPDGTDKSATTNIDQAKATAKDPLPDMA